MSFEKLNNNTISECEDKVTEYWKSINILDRSIKTRSDDNKWVFYDGPATANGNPGLHHMLAKFLKDAFCKYKTMCGKQVYRKIGWDTHGLPVEVKVEKDLGFNGKADIEKYGIDKLNKKCREDVMTNQDAFDRLTTKSLLSLYTPDLYSFAGTKLVYSTLNCTVFVELAFTTGSSPASIVYVT